MNEIEDVVEGYSADITPHYLFWIMVKLLYKIYKKLDKIYMEI